MIIVPHYDDSRLPVKLGSPLRTPKYSWSNWGISYDMDEQERVDMLSEEEYRKEWDFTTDVDLSIIAESAKRAGLSDANNMLNEESSEIVERIVETLFNGSMTILDLGCGSGNTSAKITDRVPPRIKSRTKFVLVDPAIESINTASMHLRERNVEFNALNTTDLCLLDHIEAETVDIVISVAAIHHHSDIVPPLKIVHRLLRKGGFLVIADWHNSMWEHPARVLTLLGKMEWPTKHDDISAFIDTYPLALEPLTNSEDRLESEANQQIMSFWIQYAKVKSCSSARSNLWILEGHRPARRYVEDMVNAGFETHTQIVEGITRQNPYYIMDNSSLLGLTIGYKPLGGAS